MLQRRIGLAAYPAHDRRRRVARLDGDSHHLPTPRFNDIPPDTAQSFAIRLGAPSITQIEYDECVNVAVYWMLRGDVPKIEPMGQRVVRGPSPAAANYSRSGSE